MGGGAGRWWGAGGWGRGGRVGGRGAGTKKVSSRRRVRRANVAAGVSLSRSLVPFCVVDGRVDIATENSKLVPLDTEVGDGGREEAKVVHKAYGWEGASLAVRGRDAPKVVATGTLVEPPQYEDQV